MMNEWMLVIPIGVLALITAPAFAWIHRVNERDRREGADYDLRNR